MEIKDNEIDSLRDRIFHVMLDTKMGTISIGEWLDTYQDLLDAKALLTKYEEATSEDEKHEYGFEYSELMADIEEFLEESGKYGENFISLN